MLDMALVIDRFLRLRRRRSGGLASNPSLGTSDLDRLAQVLPVAIYEEAIASCAKIYRAHGSFHIGIDLLFEEGFCGHRVIEANAFGDYLPKLRRDGKSVYDYEVERLAPWMDSEETMGR